MPALPLRHRLGNRGLLLFEDVQVLRSLYFVALDVAVHRMHIIQRHCGEIGGDARLGFTGKEATRDEPEVHAACADAHSAVPPPNHRATIGNRQSNRLVCEKRRDIAAGHDNAHRSMPAFRPYQPRVASNSFSCNDDTLIPGIALPRPRLTRAITSASL